MMRAEDRHKTALSSNTVAKLAGLNAEETAALQQWSKDLAHLALEKKRANAQLQQLAEWALKNPDKWEPSITDITKESVDGGMRLTKAGTMKRLFIQARIEKVLGSAEEEALTLQRNELWEQGVREGKIDPNKSNTNRAHMSATVGGKVEKTAETADGMLDVGKVKPMQLPKLVPPKNLEELWQRAEVLLGKAHFADQEIKELKAANGDHDLLDDGRNMADLVGKIFKKQAKVWAEAAGEEAKVPAINIGEVADGHVVTLRYEQKAIRKTFGDRAKDLEAEYRRLQAEALAASNREKTTYGMALKMFTGLEPLLVAMIGGKQIGKALSKFKSANALYVGTVRDIVKNAPDLNLPRRLPTGRQIAEGLDNMGGQLLDTFVRYHDVMAPIKGAEDLTTLLNKFKGIPTNKIKSSRSIDASRAERRAAHAIRIKYDELAQKIEPVLEELSQRKKDLANGNLKQLKDNGRLRAYNTATDFKDGKLRSTVYDELYHNALQKLHDGLKLQGQNNGGFTNIFGELISRKNTSIFSNSPKHGIANFIDNGPITLAHFGLNWGRAWTKMSTVVGDPKVRGFVDKLPILPQGDMQHIEREAARLNRPDAENFQQRLVYTLDDLNHTLGVKFDVIFKGRERLTSAADRWYTRTAAVASIYNQAGKLGIPRDTLLHGLIDGTLDPKTRAAVWRNVTADLSQLYNTVSPHLAKDLLATDPMGRALTGYSAPGRRAGRVMYDWAKSSDPKDKARFVAASAMYLAMGGRAVLPPTVRNLLLYGGATIGASTAVTQTLQNLDKANVLKNTTGWDVSDRISYDAFNIAAPALGSLKDLPGKVGAIAGREQDPGAAAAEAAWTVLGSALSAIPKLGPFGTSGLNSAYRNAQYAKKGWRPVHITTAFGDKVVFVKYNAGDAFRDTFIAGPSPQVQKLKAQEELRQAQKADSRSIIPRLMNRRSEGSVNLIPSIPREQ